MYQKFQDIVAAAQQRSPKRVIAIAAAADEKMVHVAKAVTDMGLCDVILVGDEDALDVLLAEQACGRKPSRSWTKRIPTGSACAPWSSSAPARRTSSSRAR